MHEIINRGSFCPYQLLLRLTAYVVKTFCAIQKIDGIDIDQNVINQSMNWLATKQNANGSIEVSDMIFYSMIRFTLVRVSVYVQ